MLKKFSANSFLRYFSVPKHTKYAIVNVNALKNELERIVRIRSEPNCLRTERNKNLEKKENN